jgi:murein DD-endopeptidase MepM/ murein hydrolase activator NlpD
MTFFDQPRAEAPRGADPITRAFTIDTPIWLKHFCAAIRGVASLPNGYPDRRRVCAPYHAHFPDESELVTPQVSKLQGSSFKLTGKLAGLVLVGMAAAGGLALIAGLPDSGRAAPVPVDLERAFGSAQQAVASNRQAHLTHAALAREATPATSQHRVEVGRGDTLMNLLVEAGTERTQAHAAIAALQKVYDPKALKPGQEIFLTFVPVSGEEGSRALLGLALRPTLERDIEVRSDALDGFVARAIERPLTQRRMTTGGQIETSLSVAAAETGVPPGIMIEAIRTFSFDVDFQREIQRGDTFELFYETYEDPAGRLAKTGELLYGMLTLSGKKIEYYFFRDEDGTVDYYDAKGQSVRKALLRTPVDGARISSGFGKRKHPISGYTKMHRGVDFAASRGTPIYAAGKGKVEAAGWNGGYGRYVRIRHNGSYKTAYAHMKAIAKGVKRGATVRQGQVIGYVGSTGRSTGPHLHYEVHLNGRQTNPLKLRLPSGEKLKGEKLARFQAWRQEVDRLRGPSPIPQLVDAD